MFFKIGVLKNFAMFTGKHLCWSLFLIKLQAASEFLTKLAENNCEENHFSVKFFSEIFQKSFLSLSCNVSKNDSFTGFWQFLSFFKHVRGVSRTQSKIKMAKIVNSSRGVFRMETNIQDGAFSVNSERLKQWMAEFFFLKKPHLSSTPF